MEEIEPLICLLADVHKPGWHPKKEMRDGAWSLTRLGESVLCPQQVISPESTNEILIMALLISMTIE